MVGFLKEENRKFNCKTVCNSDRELFALQLKNTQVNGHNACAYDFSIYLSLLKMQCVELSLPPVDTIATSVFV